MKKGLSVLPSLSDRASGVLLHPTSLPGPHGSGDLGAGARTFVDWLASGAQRWWQMLPVGPAGYGNSPYSAQSAFAGNPMLISLDGLVEAGFLAKGDLSTKDVFASNRVDHVRVAEFRGRLLRAAFLKFEERSEGKDSFLAFAEDNRAWLDDFALFRALKRAHGEQHWTAWASEYRDRRPDALMRARAAYAREIAFAKFEQWAFDTQWRALRAYSAARGIGLIGDIPLFVAHDSADVWAMPDLFRLDAAGNPEVVAGVPPDYFSKTGQRWGNPLYRWSEIRRRGYSWWIERVKSTLSRFDAIRLDHFIGFERYWEIPAGEQTAMKGRWMKGPGAELFEKIRAALDTLPLIAEDLGAVTPNVLKLRDQFKLPGIKILQFAFGTDLSARAFLPHNYGKRAVVYTGTHDHDTTMGWFSDPGGVESTRSPAQAEKERAAVLAYLSSTEVEVNWGLIRLALASVANTAITPLQDLLGLGSEARMNRPGSASGNWEWRFSDSATSKAVASRLRELTMVYGR